MFDALCVFGFLIVVCWLSLYPPALWSLRNFVFLECDCWVYNIFPSSLAPEIPVSHGKGRLPIFSYVPPNDVMVYTKV